MAWLSMIITSILKIFLDKGVEIRHDMEDGKDDRDLRDSFANTFKLHDPNKDDIR